MRRAGLFLAFAVGVVVLHLPFAFTEKRYNGAEGVYWQVIRQMAHGRSLYSEIHYPQFPLFIETASLGRYLFASDLFGARFTILLFAPLALLSFFWLVRRFTNEKTAALATVFLAVEPMFFNLAHQLTGEVPGLALLFLGAVALMHVNCAGSILAGVLFFLSIQFKPVLILPLLSFGALWFWCQPPQRKTRGRRFGISLAICAVLTVITLQFWNYFAADGIASMQNGHFLNFFRLLFSYPHHLPLVENLTVVADTNDYSRVWLYVFVPLLAALCGLAGKWRSYRSVLMAHLPVAVILFAYVVINPDHLILFSPIVCVLVADAVGTRQWMALSVFLPAALYFNGDEYAWRLPRANRSQLRAVSELKQAAGPEALVMGNVPFIITAAGRLTPPEYTDLSPARFITGAVTCESLEERLTKRDIQAFVFRYKGMEHADCDIEALVARYFTKISYEDDRLKIFTVR